MIVTDCLLAVTGTTFPFGKCCKAARSGVDVLQNGSPPTCPPEKTMDDEIDIQDLAADEIRELLLEEGSELDEQQAAALKQFIEDIGGLENALATIAMLDGLEKAA